MQNKDSDVNRKLTFAKVHVRMTSQTIMDTSGRACMYVATHTNTQLHVDIHVHWTFLRLLIVTKFSRVKICCELNLSWGGFL